MKTFLLLVISFLSIYAAQAQTYSVTVTPATCPANGSITIQVTDPPGEILSYTLVYPDDNETPAESTGFFSNLEPGTYVARVYNEASVIYEESVQILAQYVLNPPRITGFSVSSAFSCSGQPAGNTGGISLNISSSEGSFPLQMYLYNGATYSGSNTLSAQIRIPSGISFANFRNLAPGSYCVVLTDTCGRSVIQNNLVVSTQNISYTIFVSNTTSVQPFLKVDGNCQNYLLDPLQNLTISTNGFSISSLEYRIEWPAGDTTGFKNYFDRTQISLPLDYTTWDNTLKVFFKNPCDPSKMIGPYTMKLYTPGTPTSYPDYLPVDVLVRDLPDRNLCDVSGKAYILPFISQSNNTRTCFPVTVIVTSSDDPNFGGPKTYTWTSFTQNNYPSVSTTDSSIKGIEVTAGYHYKCVFTDAKSNHPQTNTIDRYVDSSQYGLKPKITVIPTEDPAHIGKGRFYVVSSELQASATYPITIQTLSGPAGYTPFSMQFLQKPTTTNYTLSTNQPVGDYRIRVAVGTCRSDTVLVPLNTYIPAPDNVSLSYNSSATCNSFNLFLTTSFASAPNPVPFNRNLLYAAFTQVPTGSTIVRDNKFQLVYNSTGNSFTSNSNLFLNQPSGTYVFQVYYQDFLNGIAYVQLLQNPLSTLVFNSLPLVDVASSGGTICRGNTTGTLFVSVSGGGSQKKYAIKPSGSSAYGTEQTSNQFTGLQEGKYMVRINDGCNLVEQELEMISIAGGNVIDGPDALCINETGLLATVPVGPVNSITWTLPNQTTQAGSSLSIFQSLPGTYVYKVDISTKSGCILSNQKNVYVSPDASIWTGTASTAWNDPSNWDNQLVPGACTFVTIPVNAPNYPDLTAEMTAVCDTILFQSGGEVAKTNYLTYNGAKVELKLNGQRWYMIASPLYYMYSGDFWIAPFNVQPGDPAYTRVSPKVFMRQYQASTTTVGGIQADANIWSLPYNDMNIELPGGKGYSTWVSVASSDNRTLYFPRPETKYQYFNLSGGVEVPVNVWTPELTRKNGIYHSNKLVYDGDASSQLTIYGDDENSPNVLVGNPFMSHLDFSAFVLQNPDLDSTYYIWTGSVFDVFMLNEQANTIDLTDDALLIAPMQSFVVEKKNPVKITSLNIAPEMSVVSPGNTLRSAGPVRDDIFQIEVWRDSRRESAVTFVYKNHAENGYHASKDARALFSNTVTKPAVLYSPASGYATSIRTVGNLAESLPLNIRTTDTGQLELKVDQPGSRFKVELEDRLLHQNSDLSLSAYPFSSAGADINNRFYIHVTRDDETAIDEVKTGDIRIYARNRVASIISTSDNLIRSIQAMDITGKVFLQINEVNSPDYEFEIPGHVNAIIVKVTTDRLQKVGKIVVN